MAVTRISGNPWVKIWENPDDTQSFIAQDIAQNLDLDFEWFMVVVKYSTLYGMYASWIVKKNFKAQLYIHNNIGSNTEFVRTVLIDTGVHFSACQKFSGTSSYTQDDTGCIPVAIYGIT